MEKNNRNNEELLNSIYSLLVDSDLPSLVDLINEKCQTTGISQRQLSNAIGIERKSLQRILAGDAQKIDVIFFIKLSQFLELSFENLLKIYMSKLPTENIRDIERSRKSTFLIKTFNRESLKKSGFLMSKINVDELEKKIKNYFGFSSVFEYSNLTNVAFFSKTKHKYSDKMLQFWVNVVYHTIKKIENTNKFDRDLFIEFLPKIRGLTKNVSNGLLFATKSLYELGVTVIFQTYLTGTQVRGATFIIDERPFIVITDRGKRYDTLWFALSHELYHVLKDFDRIKRIGYHLTGEEDLFIETLSEEYANDFAKELLFPQEYFDYIKNFIDMPSLVSEYAKQCNVHISMIYSRYRYEMNDYKKFQKFIPSANEAIKQLLLKPWIEESANIVATQAQDIFNKTLKEIAK